MKKFRVLNLLLVMLLIFNSVVMAEGLSDVEVDGWSEQYINKVVNTDVMPAYSDNTFKPGDNVTKMEVINVIYRIALLKGEVTEEAVDEYLATHQSTINGLLIPNILEPYGANNHRAIAYALEREIIRPSELSLFYVNGRFDVISKVDASVYMAKALNIYLEENVNKFYEIRYKDGNQITLMAWPYINLLIEKDIVSEAGNNGYFYPNDIVRRDVLSVIASGVLREVEGFEKGEETTDIIKTLTGKGTVSIIHYDKNIVEIRDQYNRLNVYDATGATITMNGDEIALTNLETGTDVSIKYSGNKLISVDIVEDYDTITGTISSVGNEVESKDGTTRLVTIKTDAGYKYYKALNSVVAERDYQQSTLDDLVKGDEVTIYYEGYFMRKVVSYSEKVILEGALQRSSNFNIGDDISIKLFNDKLIEKVLDKPVTRNFSDVLLKGDIVRLTLEKGVITKVEATGLVTEATGRITQIVISSSPSVTIVNSKGVARVFNIARDVVVKNLGTVDNNGVYALRLDQDITVELDGLMVSDISINKNVEKTEFEAEITEVHENINLIKAVDQAGKTWIVSLEGSEEQIGDYSVGDKVYIYGVELSADLFEADLIIILD